MTLGPIKNAKDTLLSDRTGTLPDLSQALLSLFRPLLFQRVCKEISEGRPGNVIETGEDIDFRGVFQPLSSRKLSMKPEGQRAWSWFSVHTDSNLDLRPDDKVTKVDIRRGNTFFRVMASSDYSEFGFFYYELVQDYDPGQVPGGDVA